MEEQYKFKSIKRQDFIERLAKESGCTRKQATQNLDDFIRTLCGALYDAEEVYFQNFGKFKVIRSPSRLVVHPATGEKVLSHGKYRIKFSPSMDLRENVREAWEPIYMDLPEIE